MTVYRKHGSVASTNELRNYILSTHQIDTTSKVVLNLGCGNDYVHGWVNLDGDEKVKADITFDLDSGRPLPILDNTIDIIYAVHILEHIHNLVFLKSELNRILKPGGIIIVVVPDFQSQDAWGDDTHCRAFSQESFLLCFWPGCVSGKITRLDVTKNISKCEWIIAYLQKGETNG